MSWKSLELGESSLSVVGCGCCEEERSAGRSAGLSQKQLKSQNCSLRPFLMLSLPCSMNMGLSLTISDCWHLRLKTYSTASWTSSLEYCGNLELQNSFNLSMDNSKGLISLSSWDISSCGYLDSLNFKISSQYWILSLFCSISCFCLMQLHCGRSTLSREFPCERACTLGIGSSFNDIFILESKQSCQKLNYTMKKVLNHEDKENRNISNVPKGGHPSQESQPKPFKPTIKVGYKLVESKEEPRRYKKPIIVMKPQAVEKRGVKRVNSTLNQRQSGAFIQCEYVSQAPQKQEVRFHRRGVEEAHEKYHAGRQFSTELRGQFSSKNRQSRSITQRSSIATERSKLSGYKNEGIKDILQYHYAGNYRQAKVAVKCNNEQAKERILRYSDIHELDFRRGKPLI